jgi:hypothetical protein
MYDKIDQIENMVKTGVTAGVKQGVPQSLNDEAAGGVEDFLGK